VVVLIAPRYSERLLGMIEAIDDESLTLAEVARRVGVAAERARIVRPSPVNVRALVAELRLEREAEREGRQAALEEVTRRLPYAIGNAYDAGAAASRAEQRVGERRRRRAS
jgi:protein involved in temperature-dependent protein secretion